MQVPNSKSYAFLNRLNRVSVIVFFKKYSPVFITILLFVLSNVLGFWNVRNIQFELKEESNINALELEERVSSFKGENIFLLTPDEVKEALFEENGYIKEAYVEKKIPSTLSIKIEEYIPLYIGYSSERCVLYSSEGSRIRELCKECLEECTDESLISISSNSLLESGKRLIYIDEIQKISKLLDTFGFNIEKIEIGEGVSKFTASNHTFTFDMSYNLDIQLNRMYLVGQKINSESMEFTSLDLRFERPVMKLK
jgi:hypothetical protein